MNKFKELNILMKTLDSVLMSDEADMIAWYLKDWKRLKRLEIKLKELLEVE
jgi:hypothetical protein